MIRAMSATLESMIGLLILSYCPAGPTRQGPFFLDRLGAARLALDVAIAGGLDSLAKLVEADLSVLDCPQQLESFNLVRI